MSWLDIVSLLVVCMFFYILGLWIGSTRTKTIGELIINKSDPTKPFFELHFTSDPDDVDKDQTVKFDMKVR